jgi:hypothetical protein
MNRECTDLEFLPVPFHPPLPARLHRLQFLRFGSFARGILNGLTQFKESAIISLEQKYHFHPPLALPSFVDLTRSSFKPKSHLWPPSTYLYSSSLVISAQSARTSPTLGRVTLQSIYQLRSQRSLPLSYRPYYDTAHFRSHHQRSTTSLVG